IHIGLGNSRKTTSQHAAPASSGTQTVSAGPEAQSTCPNAIAAPAHTGSNGMAMIDLIHFGTAGEFKIKCWSSSFSLPSKTPKSVDSNLALVTHRSSLDTRQMTQAEVLHVFRDTGALIEGHFILRSGLHSR